MLIFWAMRTVVFQPNIISLLEILWFCILQEFLSEQSLTPIFSQKVDYSFW